MSVRSARVARRGEAGTGTIGTTAGVAAFLLFLLLALQVVVGLFTTSTVTAAGHDAARRVASAEVDHDDPAAVELARAEAEAELRRLLGGIGDDAVVTWAIGADEVRLHVTVTVPGILPSSLGAATGRRQVDRTFTARIEAVR